MMKETGTNSKKFIWRQRIGFGISDYACNLAYLMVNTYLLIFYTDVAGIPDGKCCVYVFDHKVSLMHLQIIWLGRWFESDQH